jgi:maltooligosyltrehalose trehalohydrolase
MLGESLPTRSPAAKRREPLATVRCNPIGAEPGEAGTHFRVWAPAHEALAVALLEPSAGDMPDALVVERRETVPLHAEVGGYFSGLVPGVAPGDLYFFALDDGSLSPDPASRFQPVGPFGPSEVVDPSAFKWTDDGWRGLAPHEHVIYELHVGTFTPEGTWSAAQARLPSLADLGVRTIELMPVAEFPGSFGWGYDGVDLFAPTRLYGQPDDMRHFVNAAHAVGLAVILDVVYNHLGPAGAVLDRFSPHYFTDRHDNEWGQALNFDDAQSGPVREFFITNAVHWISEYHLDGLRIDAAQAIFDSSPEHVLAAIAAAARAAAPGRRLLLVAENEPQDPVMLRAPERGGHGLDAAVNDDFHHSAVVAATGRTEAYLTDYRGGPQELVSAVKRGYLYQGQWYSWQAQPRGSFSLDIGPRRFVHYLQTHDQVANTFRGRRLHELTSPGRLRALTALLLLSPPVPQLFQGQEFAASSPFHYFADHDGELAEAVRTGRLAQVGQFGSMARAIRFEGMAPPNARATFERCRLDHAEAAANAEILLLHHDLLHLRREDPVIATPATEVDGAVLGPEAFVLRFVAPSGHERLLVVNLGTDLRLVSNPEPLLGPPGRGSWVELWSSEDPRYGGSGTPESDVRRPWTLAAHSALFLRSS